MGIIKNKEELTSHGNSDARKIACGVLEHSIEAMSSYKLVKDVVHLSRSSLQIGYVKFDLAKINNVFVIGAGKACLGMAKALDEILGDLISEGVVIVKKGYEKDLCKPKNIEIVGGGHPIPDEDSYRGAEKILGIAEKAKVGDLVIGTVTGGSSALMAHPVEPMTLEDEIKVTDLLLRSGADIYEINAVRRHISATNGGRLAQKILQNGAGLINLMISDGIRNPSIPDKFRPREWYGTPLCPDSTTFQDAIHALKKYRLWEKIPERVKKYLVNADTSMETPKSFKGMKAYIFVLANIGNLCDAAERRAKEMGLNSLVLTSVFEGESREAGRVLGSIAMEVRMKGRPVSPPCVLICGGETTVTIEGESMEGGPSAELALGFAMEISGVEGVAGLAFDTDGIDGSSDIAGGLVDTYTAKNAEEKGLNIFEYLRKHDSASLLKRVNDAVFSEYTDINVCDINIVVVL
jgi:glycerate 2-kinase